MTPVQILRNNYQQLTSANNAATYWIYFENITGRSSGRDWWIRHWIHDNIIEIVSTERAYPDINFKISRGNLFRKVYCMKSSFVTFVGFKIRLLTRNAVCFCDLITMCFYFQTGKLDRGWHLIYFAKEGTYPGSLLFWLLKQAGKIYQKKVYCINLRSFVTFRGLKNQAFNTNYLFLWFIIAKCFYFQTLRLDREWCLLFFRTPLMYCSAQFKKLSKYRVIPLHNVL